MALTLQMTQADIMVNWYVFAHALSHNRLNTRLLAKHTGVLTLIKSISWKARSTQILFSLPMSFLSTLVSWRFQPPMHFGDQGYADTYQNYYSPR